MNEATMRAYRIPSLNSPAEWAQIPVPSPDSGEVLIQMAAAGLCHTDLEIMDKGVQFVPHKDRPYTLGHENVGYVAELGPGVTDMVVGEAVVVNSGMTCGTCEYCLAGQDNYCDNRPGYYGLSDDGGLAPYLLARRRDLIPIGDLDPIQAAPLGDAAATAYGAVNAVLPYIHPNGFVVVVGIGGLGSFALQFLRLNTSATIIAVDLADKLAHARSRGAHHTVTSDPSAAATIRELTGGRGADAIIDFVGVDATLQLATDVVRPTGCINFVGTGGGTLPFHFMDPPLGVHVVATASYAMRELKDLVRLAQRGLITVDVTTYAFQDLEEAYRALREGRILGRAVVTFDGKRPAA
ncbi:MULTISPECIES: alcohol dehydrogenase catalytic domain-containing protein [Streptomyces]|uniref:alcohol dehydrogenase n=1 Tax=Streptomyces dengpaensis TaxID=2049881 RepID=A0ABN5HW36_9ACTN|nr:MULTISPECIES: alcohol dehydrogenase catalytic domain-containing protein [Streptomyces]AVH54773.1 alcohol dehydrogenase [Streptomyces dengpaensis]